MRVRSGLAENLGVNYDCGLVRPRRWPMRDVA